MLTYVEKYLATYDLLGIYLLRYLTHIQHHHHHSHIIMVLGYYYLHWNETVPSDCKLLWELAVFFVDTLRSINNIVSTILVKLSLFLWIQWTVATRTHLIRPLLPHARDEGSRQARISQFHHRSKLWTKFVYTPRNTSRIACRVFTMWNCRLSRSVSPCSFKIFHSWQYHYYDYGIPHFQYLVHPSSEYSLFVYRETIVAFESHW